MPSETIEVSKADWDKAQAAFKLLDHLYTSPKVGLKFKHLLKEDDEKRTVPELDIAEQFAGSGLAYSSDLMKSLSSYQSQLGANYGSILANYTMNAQESAANRQLSAATVGAGMFADVGTAMTPSNVQTVGGSALGAGLSSGGNALQMLAFMKMLYPRKIDEVL